jgi:hypothetical protein
MTLFRRPDGPATGDSGRSATFGGSSAERITAAAAGSASQETATSTSTERGGWTRFGLGRGAKVHDPYAWRPPAARGISVQRDIPVEMTGQSLRIAGGESLALTLQTDAETLARHVAEGLESQIAEWGDPPHGFYWKPRIKLVVTPDGAVLSGKLTPIIELWGVDQTLDYASKFSRTAREGGASR